MHSQRRLALASRIVTFVIALAALLLAEGCETTSPGRPAAPTATEASRPGGDEQSLLIAADRASGTEAALYRLDAASLALESGRFEEARRILAAIPASSLPPGALPRFVAGKARVALHLGEAEMALNWLLSDLIEDELLALPDQIAISMLRADAYALSFRYLASAKERIYIDPVLDAGQRGQNHEAIWNALMQLPARTLAAEAERALTGDLRGWLSLTAISRQNQADIDEQLSQLQRWRQLWPNHPAAEMLPDRLALLNELVTQKPKRVALLLPLQGDLAPYGRAIRDGFIAANYAARQGGGETPELLVYDTAAGDLIDTYNRALAEGAEFMIGPLDRERVERLRRIERLPVPVLALNRTQGELASRSPDLYQFGLAPEDEVLQVVEQTWREGLRRALVIAPENEWGDRNLAVFEEEWLRRGGEISATQRFTTQNDYSELVRTLLGVDLSEKRAADLRRIIRNPFEFTARRRRDIDFILLLANPTQARGINPTLAFFFAEDLPVYSTSHVNDNSESRIDYVDLNGIRFCDIPWKLTRSDPLQLRVQGSWESATRALAPFYALGVDAYRLFPRVRQFEAFPTDRLFGSTGILRLDANRIVYRRLMWAQIRDGEVISIPLVMDLDAATPAG